MNPIEGCDYSLGTAGSAALKGAGKSFAVRYLARDWRGITAAERAELDAGGVDIAAVYEEDVETWRGGFATGAQHAQNAQSILVEVGLPASMPIYFAVDYDATPDDQAVIDDYLKGAASVIGAPRVGIYGGYWIVSRCAANKSAAWYWQTTAWSGGNTFAGMHLYQYNYNLWIGGVNCDATQAWQDNYGQASKFRNPAPLPVPPPAPKPVPAPIPQPPPPNPAVAYIAGIDKGLATSWYGKAIGDDKKVYAYDERSPLCLAWLESGKASGQYPAIVSVKHYDTRAYATYASGLVLWAANPTTPVAPLKAA